MFRFRRLVRPAVNALLSLFYDERNCERRFSRRLSPNELRVLWRDTRTGVCRSYPEHPVALVQAIMHSNLHYLIFTNS